MILSSNKLFELHFVPLKTDINYIINKDRLLPRQHLPKQIPFNPTILSSGIVENRSILMGCRYGTHPRNASKPPKTWSGTKVISNLPFPSILHYFLHLDLDFLRNGGVLVNRLLDFLLLFLPDPNPCDAAV